MPRIYRRRWHEPRQHCISDIRDPEAILRPRPAFGSARSPHMALLPPPCRKRLMGKGVFRTYWPRGQFGSRDVLTIHIYAECAHGKLVSPTRMAACDNMVSTIHAALLYTALGLYNRLGCTDASRRAA